MALSATGSMRGSRPGIFSAGSLKRPRGSSPVDALFKEERGSWDSNIGTKTGSRACPRLYRILSCRSETADNACPSPGNDRAPLASVEKGARLGFAPPAGPGEAGDSERLPMVCSGRTDRRRYRRRASREGKVFQRRIGDRAALALPREVPTPPEAGGCDACGRRKPGGGDCPSRQDGTLRTARALHRRVRPPNGKPQPVLERAPGSIACRPLPLAARGSPSHFPLCCHDRRDSARTRKSRAMGASLAATSRLSR